MYLTKKEPLLCWEKVFGNTNPVEIEIGSGKGRFIVRRALENPRINLIGIERALKFYRILKQNVSRASLDNVRLVRCDAHIFLGFFVPPNSVSACHIYFPDPWPKTRHHKRRLVTPDFMDILHRCLSEGATVYFATDVKDYFDRIVQVVEHCDGWHKHDSISLTPGDTDPEQAPTSYERKYLIQGRQIFKTAYQKQRNGEDTAAAPKNP